MSTTGRIESLHIYPLKSAAGIAVRRLGYGPGGLAFDRQWVVVDPQGRMLTQRDVKRLALVRTGITRNGNLRLDADGVRPLSVPRRTLGTEQRVAIWESAALGVDQGQPAADWLSNFLEIDCRLLAASAANERRSGADPRLGISAPIAFADGQPLLVVGQESLEFVNKCMQERSGMSVPMDRFRPSLVTSGLPPFAEGRVRTIRCGSLTLHAVAPCIRCGMTNIDQRSLSVGKEPLATLARVSRVGKDLIFGHYFVPEAPGTCQKGDLLQVF